MELLWFHRQSRCCIHRSGIDLMRLRKASASLSLVSNQGPFLRSVPSLSGLEKGRFHRKLEQKGAVVLTNYT